MEAHLHVDVRLRLPSLLGSADASPWRLLPGIGLVLAAIVTVLIVLDFALAEVFAGRAY